MAGLSDATIQSVRDAADIVDLASEITRLQKAGRRYKGLCPFHKEKTPSFSVDPEEGLFYCFGCGEGGDAIGLWQRHTGEDFLEAIESLASRYGIPIERGAGVEGPSPGVVDALEAARDFFVDRLRRNSDVLGYLEKRGIPGELIETYGLGYAPDEWRALLGALRGRVGEDALMAAGLVGRSERTGDLYDRFRQRLMFPIRLASGRLVGFGGRTLGDDRAKYINTAETEAFKKGTILYGLAEAKRAIREAGRAFLVEGYFDVLGAVAAGFPESIAGMGTSLTKAQARSLARYCDEVVLGFDGDPAGDKAFRRALPLLLEAGLDVKKARFPPGEDPDSLRLAEGPEALARRIEDAVPGIELELERLAPESASGDPRATARAATEIAGLLAPIRDALERWGWGQRAAERLGIPPAMLWKRLGGDRPQLVEPPDEARREPKPPSEVRTAEETVLAELLRPRGPLPPPERLPPADIFLDPDCRAIYGAFARLYGERDGRPPAVAEVVEALAGTRGAVDRLAGLLLEDEDGEAPPLADDLERLVRRWWKKRQPELQRLLRRAELEGDRELLASLLEEKAALARALHPDMTGRLW